MAWLAAGAKASAQRSAAKQVIAGAEQNKQKLQDALQWLQGDRAAPMPSVIEALADGRKPGPHGPPVPAHERLQHLWVVIEEAKGNARPVAFKHYNSMLWKPKDGNVCLPGLWNHEAVKNFKYKPEKFEDFLDAKQVEWLEDAVASLGLAVSSPLPQSVHIREGPAPVSKAPTKAVSIL